MEEGAIKVPNKIVRSETFPRTRHRQRASSGQDIDQRGSSSVPSFPGHLDLPTTPPYQQPDVKEASSTENVESNERKKRFKYLGVYLPLYRAGLKGDWQATKAILDKYPDAVRVPITQDKENILHIASLTLAKHSTFVQKLLKLMRPDDLELKNKDGKTALYCAALSGIVKIAEQMVELNNELPLIRCSEGLLPLHVASQLQNRDMVSFLFSATPFEQLTNTDRIDLLCQTISADFYDIAWKILQRDPMLATAENRDGHIALAVLAAKPFAVGSRSQMSTWERCFSWYKGVRNKAFIKTLAHQLVERIWNNIELLPSKQFSDLVEKHSSFLFVAAELGNVAFLTILIRSYPDLMMIRDESKRTLFHISVLHRQESVFNLIYETCTLTDFIVTMKDINDDNMLHFAGQLAPSKRLNIVSGAALQMQRELLWFKEVEKIMPHVYLNGKNSKGQTPHEVFTETHRDLRRNGEKWMKATTNYCMLVATLIATVVFAAAFTLPGGNQQENGTPIFLESNWFMVFFISDTIALLSSSSSILIFLSILTSRYKEEDFVKSLPGRLVFGLIALFISIIGMVVAFSATCFLVYKSRTTRIPIIIIASARVPIILFVWLHYDLWFDIILSTYCSRFLFAPCNIGLFS